MSERDAQLEELVDSLLASTVTPKVEGFLKEKRKEIVKRYGTDKPHIDVVRKRRYPTKPSESPESADPIDVALELRDAIRAVEQRNFVLPLAMFHIGALFSYFEVCVEERNVPEILHESYSRQRASAYGRKPSERKEAELDKALAPHLKTIRREYEKGERMPHHIYTQWYLNVHPKLIDEIVEINNPRTINSKKREAWTKEDLEDYAVRILREEISPIAREFGCRFGDKGVTIPRDD
jgi:hypothetical protein